MLSFGEIIRKERLRNNYILKYVASKINIDQAIISKFERGERKPTKSQVMKFAEFYNLDKDNLLIAWLSDKVIYDLNDDNYLAEKVLKVAEEKIKYKTTK